MAQTRKNQKPGKAPRLPSPISFWKWELLAAIGSLLFLVALLGLLAAYNNQPIFDWHRLTLNASVSILSTASKTALLYIFAEAIVQWKWILYACRSRPLLDVQRIDAASRGPWGSTLLLWLGKEV